jgi:hypothetical protein
MKACELAIRYDTKGNEIYHAYVKVMTLKAGKLIPEKSEEVFAKTPDEAIGFLADMGVAVSEARYAVKTMEEKGHDYASFGLFGTFLYSEFLGKAS